MKAYERAFRLCVEPQRLQSRRRRRPSEKFGLLSAADFMPVPERNVCMRPHRRS